MFKRLLSLVTAAVIAVSAIGIAATPVAAANNCSSTQVKVWGNSNGTSSSHTFTAYCATSVSDPVLAINNLNLYPVGSGGHCYGAFGIDQGDFNDCISSVKLYNMDAYYGCYVYFWTDINYSGSAYVRNWVSDDYVYNVPSGYNDQISSIRIYC